MNRLEVLARGWIECDPNRGGELGSGYHADDEVKVGASLKPRWRWFIPRAEMLTEYLAKHGFEIVEISRDASVTA